MNNVLKRIGEMGLFPAITVEDAALAAPTAKALMDGGLNVLEITLRTEQALSAIQNVKNAHPDMLLGAGTVLSVNQAKDAVAAGAEFIVAPGLNPELVTWCVENSIPVIPGCATPSEIEKALRLGVDTVKLFPANALGGINGCKALHGPFPNVKFIPMGGIDLSNLAEYADKSYIHAIGGSWLCKTSDMKDGNFETISRIVRESINTLLGFGLAHIGVNTESPEASMGLAKSFASAFGFELKQGNSSNFAGTGIEVNKSVGLGSMGHIAIKTNNLERAVYYLGKRGFSVDRDTEKRTGNKTIAVYLKDDFGGFAVHLLQK